MNHTWETTSHRISTSCQLWFLTYIRYAFIHMNMMTTSLELAMHAQVCSGEKADIGEVW